MEPAAAVTILLVVLIIAALAVFLIATIVELRKITAGLTVILGAVGEIAAKTAPVNGVLEAINKTLMAGRDLLEGLFLQKAGPDAAGLVESVFPGEGANFLRRVGRRGEIRNIGEAYPRGEAVLASLLAAIGDLLAKGPGAKAPVAAAAPPPPPAPPAAAAAGSGRITLRSKPLPGGGPAPSAGRAPSADPIADPDAPGRLDVKGKRPWE